MQRLLRLRGLVVVEVLAEEPQQLSLVEHEVVDAKAEETMRAIKPSMPADYATVTVACRKHKPLYTREYGVIARDRRGE